MAGAGRSSYSYFLGTTTEALMNDSLMRQMGVADTKKAASEEAAFR